jgi:hypothetical protein
MSPSQIHSIHLTDTIFPFQKFSRRPALSLLRSVTEHDSPFVHIWLVIPQYPGLKPSRFKLKTISHLNHPVRGALKIGCTRKGLVFAAVEIAARFL